MRGQMGGRTSALELLKATGVPELVNQNPMVSIGILSVIAAVAGSIVAKTALPPLTPLTRSQHGIAEESKDAVKIEQLDWPPHSTETGRQSMTSQVLAHADLLLDSVGAGARPPPHPTESEEFKGSGNRTAREQSEADAFEKRSVELRKLDQARLKSPGQFI